VIMDNEAGLEHISRRTTNNIDYLLVAITESPLSFDTAKNIEVITGSIKNSIRKKFLVSSMARPEKLETIKERIKNHSFEYIGNVPRDPTIEDAIFQGRGLLTVQNSPAFDSISGIMSCIGGNNAVA
jgi:CO dehydrogenase maturation factor